MTRTIINQILNLNYKNIYFKLIDVMTLLSILGYLFLLINIRYWLEIGSTIFDFILLSSGFFIFLFFGYKFNKQIIAKFEKIHGIKITNYMLLYCFIFVLWMIPNLLFNIPIIIFFIVTVIITLSPFAIIIFNKKNG